MLFALCAAANIIKVNNVDELNAANKQAKPGDIIELQNGEWKDVNLSLSCAGTSEQLITLKAASAGKVLITGHSKLRLGGSFLVVEGLSFVNGFAGDDAVIDFRINKNQLANNCRVTNCTINDFNNPKRLDENYWISFSGKKNRIDHCTFLNKKNIGVLLAVVLDDERSRENFHSIDHNYFGIRLPLASNGGEIIRVGVSQHCEFNSNTQITDNFFEHCDGETEIVSIKSGSNVVRNNLFKECQGSVVLRHGDNNTVESNIFLGNGKQGTGGVRIINKGQWVVNNLFYKCRGEGFRSPLAIMNGVPNSPANRYVPVTDAVIANNSFYNAAPISFCEGSDTERSVAPDRVLFERNSFFNAKDEVIYRSYDNISGVHFTSNLTNLSLKQKLESGFSKVLLIPQKANKASILLTPKNAVSKVSDSLINAAQGRLLINLSSIPGFADAAKLAVIELNAYKNCGAGWFNTSKLQPTITTINCKNAAELIRAIGTNIGRRMAVNLTGGTYSFANPIIVQSDITITSQVKKEISFSSSISNGHLIEIKGSGSLSLSKLNLDFSGLQQDIFITTDTSGSSHHTNFSMNNCSIKNLRGTFFEAAKSSVADSIIITNNSFNNNKGKLFNFSNETDKKGYYNVEHLKIANNIITHQTGQVVTMLRGGNDESTMGPSIIFTGNNISKTQCTGPLLSLNGTQQSLITRNRFTDCNSKQITILYQDAIRAVHLFSNNFFTNCGAVFPNKYVQSRNNKMQ